MTKWPLETLGKTRSSKERILGFLKAVPLEGSQLQWKLDPAINMGPGENVSREVDGVLASGLGNSSRIARNL
jgi:hypothetical protein